MGSLNDFKAVWGKKATGVVIGALVDGAMRVLRVAVPEATAIIMEYLRERTSPDGWTKAERIPFYIGRLTIIRQKQTFKHPLVERAFDGMVDAWIADLEGDLDDVEPIAPSDDPGTAPRDVDPYWRVLDEIEFAQIRGAVQLAPGSVIYWRDAGGVAKEYFIVNPGPGGKIPDGFVVLEKIPF